MIVKGDPVDSRTRVNKRNGIGNVMYIAYYSILKNFFRITSDNKKCVILMRPPHKGLSYVHFFSFFFRWQINSQALYSIHMSTHHWEWMAMMKVGVSIIETRDVYQDIPAENQESPGCQLCCHCSTAGCHWQSTLPSMRIKLAWCEDKVGIMTTLGFQ